MILVNAAHQQETQVFGLVAGELPGDDAAHPRLAGDRGAAGEKIRRSERRYGPFRRSITLPSRVQADRIEASAHDGVLLILVPKAEEAHAKRIQVRAGKGKPAVTGTAVNNGA